MAIKPAEIGIGVRAIKNVRDGGVLILCEKASDIEKMQKEVVKKIANNYQVERPKNRKPEVKITCIEIVNNTVNDEDFSNTIETSIRARNPNILKDAVINLRHVLEKIEEEVVTVQ